MNNRYLLFVSDTYYPGVGFEDFHSSHSDLGTAIKFLNANIEILKILQLVDIENKKYFRPDIPNIKPGEQFEFSLDDIEWEDW